MTEGKKVTEHPLSYGQQALWFVHQMDRSSTAYNVHIALRIHSPLDIDALRVVAGGVKELVGPEMGALVITHYQRILDYITPDHVHVFVDGRIVKSGGADLAKELEADGYDPFISETPIPTAVGSSDS